MKNSFKKCTIAKVSRYICAIAAVVSKKNKDLIAKRTGIFIYLKPNWCTVGLTGK